MTLKNFYGIDRSTCNAFEHAYLDQTKPNGSNIARAALAKACGLDAWLPKVPPPVVSSKFVEELQIREQTISGPLKERIIKVYFICVTCARYVDDKGVHFPCGCIKLAAEHENWQKLETAIAIQMHMRDTRNYPSPRASYFYPNSIEAYVSDPRMIRKAPWR